MIARWLETEWISKHSDQVWLTLSESTACIYEIALRRFDQSKVLPGDFTFTGYSPLPTADFVVINEYNNEGELTWHTGAYLYHFQSGAVQIEVLLVAAYYNDMRETVCLACIPESFLPTWTAFANECERLSNSYEPDSKVQIIGGRSDSFVPTVDWSDVILPDDLKHELMNDVESFFSKGIDIYKRLKLKPFRKLLLAGIPGTGKTMLCSALAKWALDKDFLVIYVSSADRYGAEFWKIESALATASRSKLPALILLEELDAYLHDEDDKALVLNVLDGAESRENDAGTLLIATTNYPEAIDERILKRPGRLDRVFIIPETRDLEGAEKMLRYYLGDLWQHEHRRVAAELVGYPGAFIREVAIYAMTQMAFAGLDELPLDFLEQSFNRLLDQITAKDDFLTKQHRNGFGFVVKSNQ